MSAEAISWAFRQEVPNGGTKLLLVAVANHAGQDGIAFAGQQLLARNCCWKRVASVTDNMKVLAGRELVARFRRIRQNGSRTSDWLVLAPGSADRGEMVDASPRDYPTEVAEAATAARLFVPSNGDPGNVGTDSVGTDAGGRNLRKTGGPEPLGEREEQHSPQTPLGRTLMVLDETAAAKRAARPKPDTVARICVEFPDVDHEAKARDVLFYLTEGPGSSKRTVNVASTFRNFCKPRDRQQRPQQGADASVEKWLRRADEWAREDQQEAA
jgi:hypothetical protein